MDTLAQVIGANARRIRIEHGAPMAAVADTARRYGAQWSTGRVTRMEHGDNSFTVEALLILSLVLTDITGHMIAPADLLQASGEVELNEQFALEGDELKGVLMGQGLEYLPPEPEEIMEAKEKRELHRDARLVAGLPASDQRIARKLEMTDMQYWLACKELWGRLLSAEVEKRVEKGASAQKKGHVTRALSGVLSDFVRGR